MKSEQIKQQIKQLESDYKTALVDEGKAKTMELKDFINKVACSIFEVSEEDAAKSTESSDEEIEEAPEE